VAVAGNTLAHGIAEHWFVFDKEQSHLCGVAIAEQPYSKLTNFAASRQHGVSPASHRGRVQRQHPVRFEMKRAFLVLVSAVLLSPVAFATTDRCNVPQSEWKPKEALKLQLENQGWKVKRIKETDGCYEVYGFDGKGAKQEAYFNPKTFVFVGNEED